MLKQMFKTISLGVTSILLLSSCGVKEIAFSRYTYNEVDNDTHEAIETETYYKLGDYNPLTYLNDKGETESIDSYASMYRTTNYLKMMNTTGISKMIVVPVDFDDYSCEKLGYGCALSKTIIQNAFFGDNSVNQYESVASFFDKSSYGKLKIDGKVTNWFRSPVSYEELAKPSTGKSIVLNIYNAALKWYKENYNDISSYYVNGVENLGVPLYLVYSAPNVTGDDVSNSALWAYTFNSGGLCAWTSFSMLNLNLYNEPDSHTLIHETGHLLGLLDYYAENGQYSPTGHVDMMDYSIGDETGYSKMSLNWTRPYVIKDSGTITINDFESSGDLVLIKENWNKTAMDEYLLLELYSPTKLNKFDVDHPQSNAKLMDKVGVKVYHVDARAAFFENKTRPVSYVSNGGYSKSTYRIGLAHSNTVRNTSEFTKYPLYELMPKDGVTSFLNEGSATNETLFYEGDSFGITAYQDFKFHDGSDLGYTFLIESIKDNKATISFLKK